MSDSMTLAVHRLAKALDRLGPYRGPCTLCDWPDNRHRVGDAITDRWRAGDDAMDIAADYGLAGGGGGGVLVIAAATLALELELRAGRAAQRDWGRIVTAHWPVPAVWTAGVGA